ncbi:MAG: hypothetical protein PHQ43_15480 [Dehalococcoidales bacterium]|nr:hypothetical protein [Dehalococcoidales bacterium]
MRKYTVDMFFADHDVLVTLIPVCQQIEIPIEEWPAFHIGGSIYHLNPNNPTADTVAYFSDKYGVYARDYSTRFLRTIWFIIDHKAALMRDGLALPDSIDDLLIKVILESFRDPIPPCLFPQSLLDDGLADFNYPHVIALVKGATGG